MGKINKQLIFILYMLALITGLAPLSLAQARVAPLQDLETENLDESWPGLTWATASPEEMGMDPTRLAGAREYALSAGGSGMITRNGVLVMSWGSTSQTYDLKSTGKSIGITALGLAMKDGLMSLGDVASKYHPSLGTPPDENLDTGWLEEITIHHLATMTAGFDKSGGYTELLFRPGTGWAYSDGGPNWLAEALTLTYREDLYTLLNRRVFIPLGIPPDQLFWRDNYYRPNTINGFANREFGGISASVDAMARLGLLYLRDGRWVGGQQVISADFVRATRAHYPQLVGLPEYEPLVYPHASEHYGLLWWNNADGSLPHVPRDAYWAWGLYESLIVVIPSLDIVATRASFRGWQDVDNLNPWTSDYRFIQPFIEPIALSAVLATPQQQHKLWIPLIDGG